ncbi:hypothetical protein BC833DRAFT_578804 [Globomyces pollinis-pini]|nr:hypothetical protein BC833DRAFT_578804 [Globomyces pollinis-pini]
MLYGQQSSPFNISPKRKKSKQNDTQPSIGRILIDFFHYFGTVFDYRNNGLSPGGWNGDDSIVLFSKKEKGFFDVKLPSHLVIIDPLDSKNNLTYNTKLIQSISTSFRDAYETIVQKVNSEVDLSNGLLKFIMNVSKESERKRLEKRIMFSKTRLSKTLDYTPALNTHSVRPMAPYPSNPAYQPYKYNQKGHSRFAPYPPTPQYYSNSGHQRYSITLTSC